MHEMAITHGIVELCEQHAAGRKILAVTVEIGVLSGVVPESVEFCFAACTSDTLAADARLLIELMPGTGCCLECGHQQSVQRLYDPCESCSSHLMEIVSGQEMRVREIEVAD